MIRRHVTPALVAFSALLLSCLGAAIVGQSWWIAAAAALVFAAASSALLGVNAFSRAGILLLSASLGLLLGACSQLRMSSDASRSYLPVPEPDVSSFTGVVVQDSSLTQKGDTVLRLAMTDAASSRRGIAAAARGSVLLFLPGDCRFSLGQQIRVRASLARAVGFGPYQWAAHALPSDVRARGFKSALWSFRADARELAAPRNHPNRIPRVRITGGAADRRP